MNILVIVENKFIGFPLTIELLKSNYKIINDNKYWH